MEKAQKPKQYDLEERTFIFAKNVREFVKKIPRTITNLQDIAQLVRSSGSIGANYIEASESISKKDFYHRLKISRKEAKESKYWLMLISTGDDKDLNRLKDNLINEAYQFMKIFGSIITKSSSNI